MKKKNDTCNLDGFKSLCPGWTQTSVKYERKTDNCNLD